MSKESFEGGKITPEQKELQKQRDAYEKQALADAMRRNSADLKEIEAGKGMQKKDVIREDAKLQEKMRLVDNKSLINLLENSTLSYKKHPVYNPETSEMQENGFMIDGLIFGKKIKIKGAEEVRDINGKEMYIDYVVLSADIDGEPISVKLAETIFDKYKKAIFVRNNVLNEEALRIKKKEVQEKRREMKSLRKTKTKEEIEEENKKYTEELKKYKDLLY